MSHYWRIDMHGSYFDTKILKPTQYTASQTDLALRTTAGEKVGDVEQWRPVLKRLRMTGDGTFTVQLRRNIPGGANSDITGAAWTVDKKLCLENLGPWSGYGALWPDRGDTLAMSITLGSANAVTLDEGETGKAQI